MKLIMIHGRDQQGKDPHELRSIWINTLEEGLKKCGLSLPNEIEIVFPFYGDILDSLVRPEDINGTIEGIIAKGLLSTEKLFFFFDILKDIAINASITEHELTSRFHASINEKGPLNWEGLQTLIRLIDLRTSLGELLLSRFTHDAFIYLTIPSVRKKINDFVSSAIDDGPCVIIGHSLGSVVGYDVLSTHKTAQVAKYVTLGSPLGLRSLRSKLTSPIGMPICVSGGWYNAYDEKDVVALNPLNSTYFDVTPEVVNYDKVRNATHNHHGITGYLNDHEVAKVIYRSLGF